MIKIKKDEPSPCDGYILTPEELYKYKNYKNILKWVQNKLENTVNI